MNKPNYHKGTHLNTSHKLKLITASIESVIPYCKKSNRIYVQHILLWLRSHNPSELVLDQHEDSSTLFRLGSYHYKSKDSDLHEDDFELECEYDIDSPLNKQSEETIDELHLLTAYLF
jgi:hypothetical protein